MLLPYGDVMNWDSPIAKTQTNFSRLTMCDIPVFTTNYLFVACLLCVWYIVNLNGPIAHKWVRLLCRSSEDLVQF